MINISALLLADAGSCAGIRDTIVSCGKKQDMDMRVTVFAAGATYRWEDYCYPKRLNQYDICFVDYRIQTGLRAEEAMDRTWTNNNSPYKDKTKTQRIESVRGLFGSARYVIIGEGENEMMESFFWHPMAFVRKSRLEEDLERVFSYLAEIRKYESEKEEICKTEGVSGSIAGNEKNGVYVPYGKKKKYYVNPTDLMYCMSKEHYVCFAFCDGFMPLYRMKLSDVYEVLEGYGFIRIHNRYIVNTRYIKKIKTESLVLSPDMMPDNIIYGSEVFGAGKEPVDIELPVSRRWRAQLGEMLNGEE